MQEKKYNVDEYKVFNFLLTSGLLEKNKFKIKLPYRPHTHAFTNIHMHIYI